MRDTFGAACIGLGVSLIVHGILLPLGIPSWSALQVTVGLIILLIAWKNYRA